MLIGLDPGSTMSGIVCLNDDYDILLAEKLDNSLVLGVLRGCETPGVHYPITAKSGDTLVIEGIQNYGMAVGKTVFDTCYWAGRFWQKALDNGLEVVFCPRPTIVANFVEGRKRNDASLRAGLEQRFGGYKNGEPLAPLRGASDKRSAFAAAAYHLDKKEVK